MLLNTARMIRKYPNRRLYDTEESRYITLADIRELVLKQVDLVVIDKKTGADITGCTLLQVICEQEQGGNAILSDSFLAQVIRAHDNSAADILADHLQESLELFLTEQSIIPREPADMRYEQV